MSLFQWKALWDMYCICNIVMHHWHHLICNKSSYIPFLSLYLNCRTGNHKLRMFYTLHGRWIGYVFKEHGSFPYHIARTLTVRRICLGHSIPSVIYVTAHRCASGLKKKFDLRSGSQRHRHFVGFFNVPVQTPTRYHPWWFRHTAPFSRL